MSAPLFDIKAVEAAADKELLEERIESAKKALLAQKRVVDRARQILRAEEMKLEDLRQQINDGTFKS